MAPGLDASEVVMLALLVSLSLLNAPPSTCFRYPGPNGPEGGIDRFEVLAPQHGRLRLCYDGACVAVDPKTGALTAIDVPLAKQVALDTRVAVVATEDVAPFADAFVGNPDLWSVQRVGPSLLVSAAVAMQGATESYLFDAKTKAKIGWVPYETYGAAGAGLVRISARRWLMSNLAGDRVELIDTKTGEVITHFDLADNGDRSPPPESNGRVALGTLVPLGHGRVASVQGNMRIGKIVILDVNRGTIEKRIELPRCP